MNFSFISSKVGNGVGGESVFEFFPKTEEQKQKRGSLIVFIFCELNEDLEKNSLDVKTIAKEISDDYFSDLIDSSFSSLKKSIKKSFEKNLKINNLEIAAAVLVSDVLNIVCFDGIEARILRDGLFVSLNSEGNTPVYGVSGRVRTGDITIFGNSSFFKIFPDRVLKEGLEQEDISDAAKTFTVSGINASAAILKIVEKGETVAFVEPQDLEAQNKLDDQILSDDKKALTTDQQKKQHLPTVDSLITKGGTALGFIKNLKQKNFYVRRRKGENQFFDSKKKVTMNIGAILVILLTVSIFFGIRQAKDKTERDAYNKKITDINHNIEEAKSLFAVSPERSRTLFTQAREMVDELKGSGIDNEELTSLENKIIESEGTILHEYRTPADVFVDLSIESEGFVGSGLVYSDDRLYAFDIGQKKVAQVSAQNKNTRFILGPHQTDDFEDIAAYSDRLFIARKDGVYELKNNLEKVIDGGWEKDVLITAYAGNIYLIDKQKSQILRYSGSDGNFSKGVNWLSEESIVDLSQAKSLAIDGKIWILCNKNEIYEMNMGNRQNFSTNIFSEFSASATDFYTDEESRNLYILDDQGRSIYVLDKDGKYLGKYISDDLVGAKSIVASEKFSRIFFLKEGKIYVIGTSSQIQ